MINITFTPRENKDKKKKSPMKYLTKVVTFCIAFIIIYTVAQVVLSYFLQLELSPTLTSCVYTFFGTEIAACAFIKIVTEIMKVFNKNGESSNTEDSPVESNEVIEG